MHVLITGHLGYIGPVLCALFKQAGHRVTGLDVGYFRACAGQGAGAIPPDREIVQDIRDATVETFEGADAVIHLAGLSNDPLGNLDPALTYEINLQASIRAAELAKLAGVRRFVFASSCSIYGAAGDAAAPLNETAEIRPVSAYAVSKARTEEALLGLADDHFSPVFLRNATAYGVSPCMRLDLVLNNLMAHAHVSGRIRILSDGTPWRPLVHIEDISLAALSAATAPREAVHGQAFNIGRNDANYQVSGIAEAVRAIVPGATVEVTGETGGDPRSYRVDFTKALTGLPGFQPCWTLERGAEQLDRWFRAGGLGGELFDGRYFIRLKQIHHLQDIGAIDGVLRPLRPL